MAARVEVEERYFAFRNRIQTFSIVNHGHRDINIFFENGFEHFKSRLEKILESSNIVKVGVCFIGQFEKTFVSADGEEKTEKQKLFLHSKQSVLDAETDFEEFYLAFIIDFVLNRIDEVELRGSGFSLCEIIELNIQVCNFEKISGSTYIELPEFLKRKRAIINVQNDDNKCFQYAVLSALFPAEHNPQRISNYKKHANSLDFTGIKYPVALKDIAKFEQQNTAISINVYMFEKKEKMVRSLRLTKNVKTKHIHLLLLSNDSDDCDEEKKSHYCWIKNMSALLSRQCTSETRYKYFCDRCLNYFIDIERLTNHTYNCEKQNECTIEMPSLDKKILKFESFSKQLQVPFVLYADLESILKEPTEQFSKSVNSVAYQEHAACSIGYFFNCSYDMTKSFYKSKRGPDCIDWFVDQLHDIANFIEDTLNTVVPIEMTVEAENDFKNADHCHICAEKYTFKADETRVRDHSHLTGKYRGSAHVNCNLHYQETRHIPVVFHNLSKYDAHFLVKRLATLQGGSISILPLNDELYISFTKVFPAQHSNFKKCIKFRFIDSFRFMASSLNSLSALLPSEKKKILHNEYKHYELNQILMLERKGVFCYDYVDSWEKLEDTVLPEIKYFFSKLTESNISTEQYEHAKKVWKAFNINNLGEYIDLYMKTDILLLADVFENFRYTCFNIYKLDPAHYFTAPGFSFDAMLKYTKTKIELFVDIDMLLFIERGVRGGISQCSHRYGSANNKYMNDYDEAKETKYLIYLDANNLYGYSMMQLLPISDFEWCEDDFNAESILNLADDAPKGYIFEVDLEYPTELHDTHKDYPLCCEKMLVPGTKNETKLLLTLFNKDKYVIHYKMLKFALQQGLKLTKIHKKLKFTQTNWLQSYIELNTKLSTEASDDFSKNLYKLLNNSIYGKSLQDKRKQLDIRLKTKWEGRFGARKLIALPNFKRLNIFDDDLVAIHMNKTKILMDKPIIIGMAILDISKVLMYDFFYNHIKIKYGENVKMLYTDTDSFILEVHTECFYSDIKVDIEKYDTSDFAEDNIYNIPHRNKKVPGVFKDELNGQIMTEFVGLKSKMYSIRVNNIDKMKKAKGVKKYVLNNKISFDDYMTCIRENCSIVRSQNSFQSKQHTVFSVKQRKVALSSADNKRYVLENNIDTLPWGHYSIEE